MQYLSTSADKFMPAKTGPIAMYPSMHMTPPATILARIRNVKSSFASWFFCSPIFFIITALPPVASMVETAVTSWMTGAVRLIAESASVPIRFDTNRPSTMV